jgi:hypothetical protein
LIAFARLATFASLSLGFAAFLLVAARHVIGILD